MSKTRFAAGYSKPSWHIRRRNAGFDTCSASTMASTSPAQRSWQAATSGQVRTLTARSAGVQAAGHQLLAGAGLAAQQHRDVERRQPADLAAQAANPVALPHQAEVRWLVLGRRRGQAMKPQH